MSSTAIFLNNRLHHRRDSIRDAHLQLSSKYNRSDSTIQGHLDFA